MVTNFIHELNYQTVLNPKKTDGTELGRGLVPRNYEAHPVGSYGSAIALQALQMPLIDPATYSERIKDLKDSQSRLTDLRNIGNDGQPIPSLNQGNSPYCWAHSTTHAVIMLRCIAGLDYLPLSAFAVAATIKNGRAEGGWGALSLDFMSTRGVPAQSFWPQGSRDLAHGTSACWENAKLHQVTEGWADLEASVYDRSLSWAQVCTCLLSGIPVVGDFNWWAHSILLMNLVDGVAMRNETRMDNGKLATVAEFDRIWSMDTEGGGLGVDFWNSWGDEYGNQGIGTLAGNKARPDGAVAPRSVTPSVN